MFNRVSRRVIVVVNAITMACSVIICLNLVDFDEISVQTAIISLLVIISIINLVSNLVKLGLSLISLLTVIYQYL